MQKKSPYDRNRIPNNKESISVFVVFRLNVNLIHNNVHIRLTVGSTKHFNTLENLIKLESRKHILKGLNLIFRKK